MITVWKYTAEQGGTIYLPDKAEILTARFQGGKLRIWARVDSTKEVVMRRIAVMYTGDSIPEVTQLKYKYITTLEQDRLIYHVFEII